MVPDQGQTTTFELLTALESAVTRREAEEWPAGAEARRVLDVVRNSPLVAEVPPTWSVRFSLDPTDLALLTVVAAAETGVALHLLLGLLSGDPRPARPTVALALELVGVGEGGHSRLDPRSPLIRHGLVIVEGTEPFPSRRLRLPDRVAEFLRGGTDPAPSMRSLLLEPVPMWLTGTETAATALAGGASFLWVHSPTGTAGVSLAAGACGVLNHPVLVADLGRLRSGAPPRDTDGGPPPLLDPDVVGTVVAGLVLEAALGDSMLVLAGAELAVVTLPLLRSAAVPVLAVSHQPWDADWADDLPLTLEAPRLTVAERRTLWESILPDRQLSPDVAALRLTPEQIWSAARTARQAAARDGRDHPTDTEVVLAARRFGRARHDGGAAVTLDDLVLPDRIHREVERLLTWCRYRDEVMAQGSLQGKGGKGTGICALFAGGPGTGKTLAAHVVADALGLGLLRVELPAVVSKYIGESERNLERVFAEAESLNSVLFFDEADALFGARSGTKDAHDRYANQEIAYLLQRMETFDGITVLATNLRGNLDPAFARRLHFIVSFPDPDVATRQRLWEHHLAAVPATDPQDPIDTGQLATTAELSGGDIRNVVLAAVFDAVAAGTPVGRRHLGVALGRELAKLGRRVPTTPWLSAATDLFSDGRTFDEKEAIV